MFEINLVSGSLSEPRLQDYHALQQSVIETKSKYESILTHTSGLSLTDVADAKIVIDFLFTTALYKNKTERMRSINVWYGHDPLYELDIIVELKDRSVCKTHFESKQV